jgi:hypothetical protein
VGVAVGEVVEVADALGLVVVVGADVVPLEALGVVDVPRAELSVPDPPAHAVAASSAAARVEGPRSRLVRLRRDGRGSRGRLGAGIRSNLSRHPGCHPNP